MKIKSFAIIILLIACTFSLNAKVAVTDVEYLKGDDFVQLHFITNKIIPIPDIFYPKEDNPQLIVMRISEVDFKLSKKDFKFTSPVIDTIHVKNKKKFVDVEIKLKEKVNYRVFTNQEGLYIEFPAVKRIAAVKTNTHRQAKLTPAKKTTALVDKRKPGKKSPLPAVNKKSVVKKQAASPHPTPKSSAVKKVAPKKVGAKKSVISTPQKHTPVRSVDNSSLAPAKKPVVFKDAVINDFKVALKNRNRVKFEFDLSGPVDYEVIPIEKAPYRLAIDFKNTKSKRIKKDVNFLNVKKVRGAYNTPQVYRVVFDLLYLKNYNVAYGNKRLVVQFFNKLPKQQPAKNMKASSLIKKIRNNHLKNNNTAKAKPVAKKNTTKAPTIVDNKAIAFKKTKLPNSKKVSKKTGKKKSKTNAAGRKAESSGVLLSRADDLKIEEVTARPTSKAVQSEIGGNVQRLGENDFFPEEKSRVNKNNLAFADDDGPEEKKENTAEISYLRNTIETGRREYTGEPMTFTFKNADLENVILFFSKVSGLSIVIDPGVSGTVTAQLYQVPWDQALEYFLKINGLDMVLEGNLLRIGQVARLAQEAKDRRKMRESREMEEDLTIISRTLSYAKVGDVSSILKKQLSQRGEILEDARSNTLIISEVPDRIERIDNIIDTLDVANRQVSIEARIVETNSNYTESLGIQWGYGFTADAMYGNQTTLKFPNSVNVNGAALSSTAFPAGPLGGYAINLPASGANSGTVFSFGNVSNTFRLDMALSAMESKGKGRIISAPKTTTQNNMEATIMQGKQIPVQTVQNNTVTVKYVNAALELKVTPQITAKGTVICQIDIKNNSADFANLVNQIPPIITQTIKTTVMVGDGGTIVIGGMYRVEDQTTEAATPFLSKVPILGKLFKNKNQRREQKELLIFITPRIIK
ncbi:MAG: type IV pilus secretin PilQ [bacterium]|nr:type IV pilus secretin PilQ [bacterium]